MVCRRICYITFPGSSSLSFLKLEAMFAAFLSFWTSLKMTESSLAVTSVSLTPSTLRCSLPGPLDLCPSNWFKSYQSWSSSAVGNSSLPQTLPLGPEAEVRAEFTRKNQEDTEKAEVTSVTSLGNLVSTSPAPLSSGLTFFLAFLLLKAPYRSLYFWPSNPSQFQLQLSCGFPVPLLHPCNLGECLSLCSSWVAHTCNPL